MGGSILNGYAKSRDFEPNEVLIFGVNREKLEKNAQRYRVKPCLRIEELVKDADVIFIGIKPDKFDEVLPKISKEYTPDKVCVSMAAGISLNYIKSFLGEDSKVVRIMPNTPAMIRQGITSISHEGDIPKEAMEKIRSILGEIGKVVEVPERLIHSVIGAGGSSPAYTYIYIDGLINAAMKYGMEYSDARILAAQSVLGAAQMVLESDKSLGQLAEDVCSPGGTTIESVNYLKGVNFQDIVENAAIKAIEKSKKMEK